MRLGRYDCHLVPETRASAAYADLGYGELIQERHRHRFEFNNAFRGELERHGMVFCRALARRPAGGDRRTARPSLHAGQPVPSGVQEPAQQAASAVPQFCQGGDAHHADMRLYARAAEQAVTALAHCVRLTLHRLPANCRMTDELVPAWYTEGRTLAVGNLLNCDIILCRNRSSGRIEGVGLWLERARSAQPQDKGDVQDVRTFKMGDDQAPQRRRRRRTRQGVHPSGPRNPGGGPAGADPNSNFALRLAVDRARAENMPKDNIDRAIRRGAGLEKDGDEIETIIYEGYGPHGVALLVECLTDNRNRTISDLRRCFTRAGGGLGEPNSVAWQFTEKVISASAGATKMVKTPALSLTTSSWPRWKRGPKMWRSATIWSKSIPTAPILPP